MRAFLWLFLFGSIVAGHVVQKQREDSQPYGHLKRGTAYMVGEYTLIGMKNDQQILVAHLLRALFGALQPVIKDAKAIKPDGTPDPSPAFETFFKEPSNMPFVAELLSNITTGASVVPPTSPAAGWQAVTPNGSRIPGVRQPITPNGSPVLAAVTRRKRMTFSTANGDMVDAFDICNGEDDPTAVYMRGDPPLPLIILCPGFFTQKAPDVYGDTPPASTNGQPASNCMRVNPAKTRFAWAKTQSNPLGFPLLGRALGQELIQYRTWILMEALTRHYLHVARGATFDVKDINEAVRLSAEDSLDNGPSWLYYAANVWAKCTQFPDPNTRKNSHDILGLMDVGGKSDNINDGI